MGEYRLVDGMEQVSEALANNPVKVFLPGVGHRMVTTTNGKTIDAGGKDVTDKLLPPKPEEKKEVIDDGNRSDPVNMRFEEDPITLSGNTAVESFKNLRDLFLQKSDTDKDTLASLDSIENMIKMTIANYEARKNQQI